MWFEILLLSLGLAAHFAKDMMQYRADGVPIQPWLYWKNHPYQTILSLCSAIAGFLVLEEIGQLNGGAAFLMGYAANSAAESIGARQKI